MTINTKFNLGELVYIIIKPAKYSYRILHATVKEILIKDKGIYYGFHQNIQRVGEEQLYKSKEDAMQQVKKLLRISKGEYYE